jgi:serine phosphatase RsbU (regulator of sigma subunit)
LVNAGLMEQTKLENVVPIGHRHRSPAWGHRTASWPSPHAARLAEALRRNHALEDQLAELRREHDHLRHTFFEAAQVQRKLCGTRHLRRKSFEIASEIFPVRDLSGDFIGIFESDNELVLAIGDISGKGLAAGMWFAHMVSTIRLQCARHRNPAAALSAMNRDLMRSGLELPFTSLLLCRLKLLTGEIAYCNAGHPPAVLLRGDGQVETLREGGPLLGVLPGASYATGKTALKPGDTLLGYSDGVVECSDQAGGDFGMDRLLAAAQTSSGSTATLFSVLGAVEDFAGSHPREDDLALLVVHRASDQPRVRT